MNYEQLTDLQCAVKIAAPAQTILEIVANLPDNARGHVVQVSLYRVVQVMYDADGNLHDGMTYRAAAEIIGCSAALVQRKHAEMVRRVRYYLSGPV